MSRIEPASDVALLHAWRGGDRCAGEQLFERHFAAILAFFRRRVDRDAEDLTQRTFLACLESREHVRGTASFRTFLFSVAHNVLGNHFRHKRRREDRTGAGASAVLDLSPSSTMVMAVQEERELLWSALDRLPLPDRRLLELYYWEKHTSAEIACELGVPHGTARTRLRRARRLLREELDRSSSWCTGASEHARSPGRSRCHDVTTKRAGTA
jgi:RNA polymerase sigma factor (sigma-70 family)